MLFEYLENNHQYHRDEDSYKKYDYYDLMTLRSYNNACDRVRELQKFYQDFPNSKVFQPEQFGLSWEDIHKDLDIFYNKMIDQESKRWRINGVFIWDGYFRSKFDIEEKWNCPTLFVGILLYLIWAIVFITLDVTHGSNINGFQTLLVCIFVIPDFILGYIVLAYIVQYILVIIQYIIITRKQNKITKWFMTTDTYTIMKAQNREIQRFEELCNAFDF